MDHRDATLELCLDLGIAGGGESQLAEFLVLLAEGTTAQRCSDSGDKYQKLRLHGHLRAIANSRRGGLLQNIFANQCLPIASSAAVKGEEIGTFPLPALDDVTAASTYDEFFRRRVDTSAPFFTRILGGFHAQRRHVDG
jgi:hypothetical protein